MAFTNWGSFTAVGFEHITPTGRKPTIYTVQNYYLSNEIIFKTDINKFKNYFLNAQIKKIIPIKLSTTQTHTHIHITYMCACVKSINVFKYSSKTTTIKNNPYKSTCTRRVSNKQTCRSIPTNPIQPKINICFFF